MSVMVVTSLGDMVVDLNTDLCPLTCKNFLKLCKIKYYNGCLFHTIQKDFTAQTGDPTGTGSGGDSIYKFLYGDQARFFSDEIRLDLKHSKIGTISMASAGENLNASQFYITLRDDLDYLDGKHTVFGEVAEGLETLTRINEAYVDEKGKPYKNIRIKHTYVLDDPFDDPPLLAELIPDASPEGKPKDEVDDEVRLEDDWVPMDDQLGPGELEEVLRSKEAHSSAVVLESIGDIPEAEIKPPDNVLFVCKLNPVTEDEDLHTIFSRFGTVTSADIIRDYKTGDSLCYAFIEFEDKKACEQAYFKMDNALIDDRRIHVDFSQSVAKLWSQYRRRDNQSKGRGCFKCGSLDHIAKDCPGDATMKQQPPKYILKEDNTQHGGDNNSRYEMVFDGDGDGSPRRNESPRDREAKDFIGKQNVNRERLDDLKERDHRKRDSRDRDKQSAGSKEQPDDDRHWESRTSPSAKGNRDHRDREKNYGKRDEWDYKRKSDNSSRRDRRDVGEHERRYADDVHHGDGMAEKDYRKRSADNDARGDLRDDARRQKGTTDNNRRDSRDEGSDRKFRADDGHRKVRGEERNYTHRSSKGGDARDRNHDRGRDRNKVMN